MNRSILFVAGVAAMLLLGRLVVGGGNAPRSANLWNILDMPVEMQSFQGPMSFKDALRDLHDVLAKKGLELPIVVNVEAFKTENPDAPSIYDTQIIFPRWPKKMPIGLVLEQMLAKFNPPNATYIIRRSSIVVTTMNDASPDNLRQVPIQAGFNRRPLAEVLDELSDITGMDIWLDSRLGDKAKTPVTARFRNCGLDDALLVVADMADLKAVFLSTGFYVTTPANAEKIKQELKSRPKLPPRFPFGPRKPGA
jgi:hypothetical protein